VKIAWRAVNNKHLRTVAESTDGRFVILKTEDGAMLRDRLTGHGFPAKTALHAKQIAEFGADVPVTLVNVKTRKRK
jgi:hypothetical protein